MPTVPRYNSPQIRETALPNVQLNPGIASNEAFGGGKSSETLTAAELALGDKTKELISEEKKKADQVVALDFDKNLSAYETNYLHDPKTGALQKKGKDAFSLPETSKQDFDKYADELEGGLYNADQKMAARRMRDARWADINKAVQTHVGTQMSVVEDTTTDAYIKNERDAAAANFLDNSRINLSIERQNAAIYDHAKRKGLPEEWTKLQIGEATSKTNVAVIDRLLNSGLVDADTKAKEYYDTNKDHISGLDSADVQKKIEAGTLRGESQRSTDKIIATTSTMTESLDAARQIENPHLRDEVSTRIKDFYSTKKAADTEMREQLYTAASNIIEKTPSRDAVPTTMWANLSLTERNALDARAKQLREGTPPSTEWEQYYNLKTMAAVPETKDDFMKLNLMVYRPKLADAEFKQIVEIQTDLRKGKTNKELDGYRTNKQIFDDTLNQIGIDPTPKPGSEAAKKVAEISRIVDERVMSQQQSSGKPINSHDFQRIIDDVTVEGISKKGWIFDTKKRQFELNNDESVIVVPVEKIPRAEVSAIRDALNKKKIPVTDERISAMYMEHLKAAKNRGY